jgi:D-glycero-D-manno-heptose 1,7-bisphosphate phosphatase
MTNADPGLWCQIDGANFSGRPALFLDRDGVIVADTRYIGRPESVQMIDGAASAIARCNRLGIPVVVVTNQSGIARGYYDWDGFHAVQRTISDALASAGAHLDAVFACAYHAEGSGPLRIADHFWRKPNPGMILDASQQMNLDPSRSWIVGDKAHDIAAGSAAGLAGGTALTSDEQELRDASALASARFEVEVAANLADAVAELIKHERLAGHGQP